MATLGELRDALFPAARPAASLVEGAEAESVGWVRVLRARVPAFDALEPGDVVIVPASALAVVAPGEAETVALVDAFRRARVAGLLLVGPEEPEVAEPALDALAASGSAAGLPAFRLGRVDPGTLERSVIAYLVNRRAELEHRAAVLEGQLTGLALGGRGLDVLAGTIAAFLGRAVAIEGRRGDALAVHAPADRPEAAADVAAYLARPATAALRVPLPAGTPSAGAHPARESGASGRLVLLGDRPIGELERVIAERIAPLLALELIRDAAVRQARDEARRGEPLPSGGPPWVVLVARQRTGADPEARDARERLRTELRLLAPARKLTLRGSSESLELRLVAACDDGDPLGLALARRIAGYLGRTVAVSQPFEEPGSRATEEAAARAALEASEALPAPPAVARADRLAAYRMLGNLRSLPDGHRMARALLEPALSGRPSVRHERMATLRAVLDAGSPTEAAVTLGVHRNTIAYRLHRIEALTGWDLADPDLRLALAVAIRIVQSEQE